MTLVLHAQVFGQPVFELVENGVAKSRPAWAGHIPKLRIVWRSAYVVFTAALAISIPFFQALMGLVGASLFIHRTAPHRTAPHRTAPEA